MQNQAVGLAEAMGAEQIICHTTELKGLWRWMAPYIRWGWNDAEMFQAPWPEVIIACGRKAITAALWLKKHVGIPVVYVQNPYISTRHFDAVVVPSHDNLRDTRAIPMTGACHRISKHLIDQERKTFADRFGHAEKPRRSIFIGGPNRCFDMPLELIQSLVEQMQKEPGTLWVTVSRRTPTEVVHMLQSQADLHLITPKDIPNPYMGLLAWSDVCVLTCDSVSMASEVVAAGVPLYLVKLPGGNKKFQRFHHAIETRGLMRWWHPDEKVDPYDVTPFEEMPRVAACVRQRLEVIQNSHPM